MTATEDGEKAWEHFKAGGLDIVVTDWEMPLLSGLDLVKRIRESAAATYVYVLMLTSRTDESDIVSGIEAGADDFVSKPFDREELRVPLLAGERIVRLERALLRVIRTKPIEMPAHAPQRRHVHAAGAYI